MSLFDCSQYIEFNNDRVVLSHELGHVVTWLHLGEGIGRLKCCRRADNQLMPHVALWPRKDEFEKLFSPEYAQPFAERLLAGEIAARHALNMRTDQICSKGLPVDSTCDNLACVLRQINDTGGDLAKEDVVKVLTLALQNAPSDWRTWIADRFNRANAVVHENWGAIHQIAQKLESRLPAVGKSRVWTGGEIIACLERCGVFSGKRPAVEIVFNDQPGGFLTKLRRFLQEMGPNGIICRYVDNPAERMQ